MYRTAYSCRITAMLFMLILLVLGGGYGCNREVAEQREKARLLAEAKKTRIEAKVTPLLNSARVAHHEKNYAEALKLIREAFELDPKSSEAARLQKEVRLTCKLAKLAATKDDAEAKWTATQKLDRQQGVGKAIDAIKPIADAAAKLFEEKKHDEASAKYQQLAQECDKLKKLDSEHKRAKARRADAEKARASAATANAERDASKKWSDGTALAESAAVVYEKSQFTDAARMWKVAVTHFSDAEAWAKGTQMVRAAKTAYDKDLVKAKLGLLEKFGGETWAKTKQSVNAAGNMEKEGKWSKSVAAWQVSQAWLKQAVVATDKAKKKHEREQALANCRAAVARANKTLVLARNTPKHDKKGLTSINEELAAIDKCKEATWYALLRRSPRKSLASAQRKLEAEKFYFLYPDLTIMADAKDAPLDGLAEGSVEAQEQQKQAADAMGMPVEVQTRKIGIRFRLVPAGKFMMGSPESEKGDRDETYHQVRITRAFYVGMFEITQGQWKKTKQKNRSQFKNAGDDAPVENVQWMDIQSFCLALCKAEGVPKGTYRIPTEAEWEYACRAGTTAPFCTGSSEWDFARAGWCTDNSGGTTHPVGKKAPNAWGLYDMHGNVWEWCRDSPRTYTSDAVTDPVGKGHKSRSIRGGGWYDKAWSDRSANRGTSLRTGVKENDLGFRIVRTAAPMK